MNCFSNLKSNTSDCEIISFILYNDFHSGTNINYTSLNSEAESFFFYQLLRPLINFKDYVRISFRGTARTFAVRCIPCLPRYPKPIATHSIVVPSSPKVALRSFQPQKSAIYRTASFLQVAIESIITLLFCPRTMSRSSLKKIT